MSSALEGPNFPAARRSSTLPGSDSRLDVPTVGCAHGYSRSSPSGLLVCQVTYLARNRAPKAGAGVGESGTQEIRKGRRMEPPGAPANGRPSRKRRWRDALPNAGAGQKRWLAECGRLGHREVKRGSHAGFLGRQVSGRFCARGRAHSADNFKTHRSQAACENGLSFPAILRDSPRGEGRNPSPEKLGGSPKRFRDASAVVRRKPAS